MSTVGIGIFRLLDPPAGQVSIIRGTIAAINFPWERLTHVAAADPDGAILIRYVDTGQQVTGQYVSGSRHEILLSTRYAGWQDQIPFVFTHECGHMVDKELLAASQRSRLLALMHASPETHRYDGEQLNGAEHPWSHNQPHDPDSWPGDSSAGYLHEPDEAFADLFVAAFAPSIWRTHSPRFVHWTDDLVAVRRLVLDAAPLITQHGWVPPCLPVEVR